jgi:hypothetical protein
MKPSDRGDRVVGFLRQHPVASFEALEKQLKVSRRTVRRALAQHGYYSSCNGNGTYVTLRETPQFTPEGLWVYRQSCFSSHGTLLQTVVALVEASPAGKTLAELEEQLCTRVHNQLSWLLQDQKLTRVYSGRHVVYLSCDSARAAAQQRQRPEPARPEDASRSWPRNCGIVASPKRRPPPACQSVPVTASIGTPPGAKQQNSR